jgi:insertion element IS1 protein InsB
MWSFVGNKKKGVWLWSALCRRTRQIVAFVIGDRSESNCKKLACALPEEYRKCISYSDKYFAYERVFPTETHCSLEKRKGQLNHIERWHNILRQKLSRYVRKTLSFSKSLYMHELVTRWFIIEYNLSILITQ